jgi:basic membrane protein A and related proteins
MRKLVALCAGLALLVPVALWAAVAGSGAPKKTFKVGFIYVDPVGTTGWTYQMDLGRKYLEQHVPGVQTNFLENVAEANVGAAIDQLVGQGDQMTFATSFGYGPGVVKKAKQYPKVIFEHATGYMRAKNVGTYYTQHWQASYLNGMIAGKMTKSNILGYVGSFPIAEVIRDVNAYTLGAQSVNPKAKVKVVMTSTWYDPPKEKQAARALIDAGADAIFGIEDSPAILQEAATHQGVYASTWNSNMVSFGPKAFLSADVLNWGQFDAAQVKAAMAGKWHSMDWWGSLKDGSIALAPFGSSVPKSVRSLVSVKEKALANGLNPFKGPIRDQKGNVRVPAGKTMTFAQIVDWRWLVQGVQGKA